MYDYFLCPPQEADNQLLQVTTSKAAELVSQVGPPTISLH